MVSRLNRPAPLPQIGAIPRVDQPVVQRALDALTLVLESVLITLRPIAQPLPWHKVGMFGEVAFNTGWQNYTGSAGFQTLQYRKNAFGRVELRGLVERASGVATTIFTLPVGYRPAVGEIYAAVGSTGAGRVDIQADGQVIYNSGGTTYFSVSGVTFEAA